jgi:hypothetical protein
MHRSSETIGNISGALAKAQIELTNPEKSLLATIRSPFPREPDRTFRYAPLSSGLDIVRKTLGRHEIAAIQSTSIDNEGGLLRLTTVLAHSSGEWISSEWPICRISDIGSAQRMGAALTYARRYGLFTLVGIAGEDDLDAPDLGADPTPSAELARAVRQSNGQIATARLEPNRDRRPEASARSVLGEQLSASLRETLIGQLVAINSGDEAAAWAQRNMRAKNSLTAADAKNVEERFQERLSKITDVEAPGSFCNAPDHSQTPDSLAPGGPPHAVAGQGATSAGTRNAHAGEHALTTGKKRSRSNSLVALGKAVRLRDKDHRKFVFRQACLVCGRVPSDPHHLTFTQPRALGRRVSDEFLVPVCRVHHRELHRSGNEVTWWRRLNIDPLPVALRLWQQTRADDRTSRDARTESKAGTQGAPSDRASKKPA